MKDARVTTYAKTLKALSREGPVATDLPATRRLYELARAVERHRYSPPAELSGFADELDELLHFELSVHPVAGSNGAALRLRHHGAVKATAKGPFKVSLANRLRQSSAELQRELSTWLGPLQSLLTSSPSTRAPSPPGFFSGDLHAVEPPYREAPNDAGARPVPDPQAPAPYDPAGLPGETPVRTSFAAWDTEAGAQRTGFGFTASDIHSSTSSDRGRPQRFESPSERGPGDQATASWPAHETRQPRQENDAYASPRESTVEARSPASAAVPPPEGGTARPSPWPEVPSDLPPRLARAFEELRALRPELSGPAPTTVREVRKFFTEETLDNTSLLDRLDRLAFTSFDPAVLPAWQRHEPPVRRALQVLEQAQAAVIDLLEEAFSFRSVMPDRGDPFDPTLQQAVETVAQPDRGLDRTVAEVLAPGYACDIGSETTLLLRPRVHIFVYEEGADPAAPRAPAATSVAAPVDTNTGVEDGLLDVPVDSSYPGEHEFGITVYARWQVGGEVHAWIEVDGRTFDFAHVDVVPGDGRTTELRLAGCDIPEDIYQGDGYLFVRDEAGGRLARHPFEVLV